MPNVKPTLKSSRKRIALNWSQLRALLDGVSAIDLESLAIRNRKTAKQFAIEYGIDPDDPSGLRHICEVHREALEFIREFFLEPHQYSCIPESVSEPESVLDLLVMSSTKLKQDTTERLWSCAILKVMHGLFHIDHDFKLRYFDHIRSQIFTALDRLIVSDDADNEFLTDGEMVLPLYTVQKKRNKGRKSVLLKLLQKPRYVASDIYDHLGMRFVFETRMECLLALNILRKSHLITVTNLKPFRSRNTMLELRHARRIFQFYRPVIERVDDYPLDLLRKMDEELRNAFPVPRQTDNPFSAEAYQAIQMTARRMVRIPRTQLLDVPGVSEEDQDPLMSFYFDFELQLLPKQTYLDSLDGPSSHEAYKRRQIATARKRVFGPKLTKLLQDFDEAKREEAFTGVLYV